MRVVAVGAHPDDIELGVGATIGLHKERGDSVTFIILTNGSAVEGAEVEGRKREARESAAVLDVEDIRFLNYNDTELQDEGDVVQNIESHITDVEPDRIYTHSEEDTHQDHRNAALASIAATRKYDNVFSYESPSTRSCFTPHYFISFPKDMLSKKVDAIKTHESQAEKKYMEAEAMNGLARFRGRQSNSEYAESFEVVRCVDRFVEDTESRL